MMPRLVPAQMRIEIEVDGRGRITMTLMQPVEHVKYYFTTP